MPKAIVYEVDYKVSADRQLLTPCPYGVRTADRRRVVEVASAACSYCKYYGGWLHGYTIGCKHPLIEEGEKHPIETTLQYVHDNFD